MTQTEIDKIAREYAEEATKADTDPNRGSIISLYKPTDPTDCTLFWREKGDGYSPELTDKLKGE